MNEDVIGIQSEFSSKVSHQVGCWSLFHLHFFFTFINPYSGRLFTEVVLKTLVIFHICFRPRFGIERSSQSSTWRDEMVDLLEGNDYLDL